MPGNPALNNPSSKKHAGVETFQEVCCGRLSRVGYENRFPKNVACSGAFREKTTVGHSPPPPRSRTPYLSATRQTPTPRRPFAYSISPPYTRTSVLHFAASACLRVEQSHQTRLVCFILQRAPICGSRVADTKKLVWLAVHNVSDFWDQQRLDG